MEQIERTTLMLTDRTGKLKILFVEEVSGMGGSTVCLSSLIKSLPDTRVQPVLALYFKDSAIEKLMFPDLKIYHMKKYFSRFTNSYLANWKSLPLVKQILKIAIWGSLFTLEGIRRVAITFWIIKSNKVDVVATNNCLGTNMFSIIAAKLANVPCVCHTRGFGSVSRLQKISLEYVAAIVTMSNSVRDFLNAETVVQKTGATSKIITIYDGLTRSELSFDYSCCKGLRHKFDVPEDKKVVGMVGMLTEWKGFHVFLEAAKYVLEEGHNVVFFVVGDSITKEDTSYRQFLHSTAAETGISDHVVFTGQQMDIQNAYWSLDVVVHASLSPEAFGRVVIEAMAASKPVVAVNAGGPAEIIQHGQTGLLYSSGDAHELAQQIMLLLSNPDLSERIGKNARKHVEDNFSIDTTVRKTMQVYDETFSQGRKRE
jgi:glycosyltransferase involved in cell wall biosynthesis